MEQGLHDVPGDEPDPQHHRHHPPVHIGQVRRQRERRGVGGSDGGGEQSRQQGKAGYRGTTMKDSQGSTIDGYSTRPGVGGCCWWGESRDTSAVWCHPFLLCRIVAPEHLEQFLSELLAYGLKEATARKELCIFTKVKSSSSSSSFPSPPPVLPAHHDCHTLLMTHLPI